MSNRIKPTPSYLAGAVAALFLAGAQTALAASGPVMPGYDADGAAGLPVIANLPQQAQAPRPVFKQPALRDEGKSQPFASYVKQSTGADLPIFGASLFDSPATFAALDAVQVNPDYVIGNGDQLQIKGWGMVDIDLTLTVDRSGNIYLPRVGAVPVAGVKYRELQGVLKKSVARVFNNFDLSVSLAQTRAVQIYVVGHALRPGSYTLSAMSSLLNALFASGGPDASGSLRAVKLVRDGKTVATLDLYKVLVDGDKSQDQNLRDGDVIQIPPAGPRAALLGDVKTPAIFEFKRGETVAELMGWAGGVESAAESKEVLVEQSVNNKFATIAQLHADDGYAALAKQKLSASGLYRAYSPGARPVSVSQGREFVSISGEAGKTGTFQIGKGETLRGLMLRLGGVNEYGYPFAIKLERESVRQAQQARLDEIATRFERELEQNATQRLSKLADKDNIAAVQAETERQRQLAAKMRQIKAEGRIVLEMNDASAQIKDLPDVELQGGDRIEVPRRPGTVNVLGAVVQGNTFIYRPGRTTKEYLALAGGPGPSGDEDSLYILRADGTVYSGNSGGWFASVGGQRLNPGDTVVMPEKQDRGNWTQTLKEWTTILYQFGLGAAGLKVLK